MKYIFCLISRTCFSIFFSIIACAQPPTGGEVTQKAPLDLNCPLQSTRKETFEFAIEALNPAHFFDERGHPKGSMDILKMRVVKAIESGLDYYNQECLCANQGQRKLLQFDFVLRWLCLMAHFSAIPGGLDALRQAVADARGMPCQLLTFQEAIFNWIGVHGAAAQEAWRHTFLNWVWALYFCERSHASAIDGLFQGNPEALRCLQDFDFSVLKPNYWQAQQYLHRVLIFGYGDCIPLVQAMGADVNQIVPDPFYEGRLALQMAIFYGSWIDQHHIVQALIQAGARLDLLTEEDRQRVERLLNSNLNDAHGRYRQTRIDRLHQHVQEVLGHLQQAYAQSIIFFLMLRNFKKF
jgi:hypothetical protein